VIKSLGWTMGLAILFATAAYGASEGSISGILKGPGGVPLKGAFIRARNASKSRITTSVLSDQQGRYRIENLPPGEYEVWAAAIGYQSDPARSVKVAAGKPVSRDFSLQKGMVRWSDLSNAQAYALLPEGKGKSAFFGQCFICHGFQSRIVGTNRTPAGWASAVQSMTVSMRFNLGDVFSDQDARDVGAYLNSIFGADSNLPRSPADLPGYKDIVRRFSDEAMNIVYVDYELPKPNSFPFSAYPAKDGKIWIPEFGSANRIARMDPITGELQEFQAPHQGVAAIHSALPAPDGTVWFAEQGPNKLGKWDPRTQKMTEYQALYTPGKEGLLRGGSKHTIRIDSKGMVWSSGYPLTRFDPKMEKFTYYREVPGPYSIALDAEGSVWFCELREGGIGKVDAKSGQVQKWPIPTKNAAPRRIEIDPQGVVWVGEFGAGKIARFEPKTEMFKEYPLPGPDPTPYALSIDRNNQVWYSSHNLDVIGRLDPKTGRITEYPFAYPENTAKEFFLDAQGRIWFGTMANNRVGYFMLAGNGSH
jgi:virginiamycin B lyase